MSKYICVCLYICVSVCVNLQSKKCKTPKEFSWDSQYRCLISSSCVVDMFVIFKLNFKCPYCAFSDITVHVRRNTAVCKCKKSAKFP